MTTRGAVIGGLLGVGLALVLTILSPAVWVSVLGHAAPVFPYSSPAIFSVPVAFLGIWLFSITDGSKRAAVDRAGFDAQEVRSETGLGAYRASGH
jgi:cation/acetate symporter